MSQVLSLSSDPCLPYIQTISESECVGESLQKINLNFQNLETVACNLKEKIENIKTARTFFYYGTNTQSNVQQEFGSVSRPSNSVIYNFLNNTDSLNLPSISYPGDIAYVIYQKTGFLNNQLLNITTDYSFDTVYGNTTDIDNQFAPIFVIWKYTYNRDNNAYEIDDNFPKFVRNLPNTGANWNDPTTWTTFDSWN
jgi:hypothetical protein